MIKKLKCNKHNQHLFYIYIDTKTGHICNICQVCEDEALTKSRNAELKKEGKL